MMMLRLVTLTTALIAPFGANALKDGKGLFSYDPVADNGPEFWPTLATDEENQCGGNRQSPIPLTANTLCSLQNADYEFNGGTCSSDDFNYFNNDHSVEAEYPEEGCVRSNFSMPGIDGVYEITQFHTHTGSEHTVEGFYANFELHCVHKLKSGTGEQASTGIKNSQAVFGMFILAQGEDDNAAFQPLLDGWQAYQDDVLAGCGDNATQRMMRTTTEEREQAKRKLQAFNVYELVSPDSFIFYGGSLTTPPCTEDLWWNVANDPIILSVAQGKQLDELILGYRDENCTMATGANPFNGFTSRPPQDIFGRTVSRYCLGEGPAAAPTSGAVLPTFATTAIVTIVSMFIV